MKQLLQAENIDEKRWPARILANIIDGWKNRGLTPDQVKPGEAAVFANGLGRKLYEAYQARLKTLNAVDFGDLLLETIRLFRGHPQVLQQYQQRFRFILVDEYQDTNVAQYLWLRLLAQSTAAPAQGEALPNPAVGLRSPGISAQAALMPTSPHRGEVPWGTDVCLYTGARGRRRFTSPRWGEVARGARG